MSIFLIFAMGCVQEEFPFVLQDSQNYFLTSAIDAETQVVVSGEDSPVDWSGLTTDLQGYEMDPSTDIDEIRIVRFGSSSPEEVLEQVSTDSLMQSDITGFVQYEPTSNETSANLTDFYFGNIYLDVEEYIVEGSGSAFLIAALTGTTYYRMMSFFDPVEDADPSTIYLDSDSAVLSFDVDLLSSERISTRNAKHYPVDWSELTTNGYGDDIELSNIDWLYLARYSMDLTELEQDFLRLEVLSDFYYEADVEGLGEYDLAELTSNTGEPFDGFDKDGTWVLALRCSTCINPAPLFLGVFE